MFLRKETYFNFNRIFLVGSLALALVVPLLHLTFFIPQGSSLENPARGVAKFRNSYEEMIRMIDADFGTEPGSRHMIQSKEGADLSADEGGIIPLQNAHGIRQKVSASIASDSNQKGNSLSLSRILIILYIGGVIYFLSRFFYLVIRLYLLVKRNRVSRQEGFRMVEIEEDISPFSFFRFLFINHGSFDESELDHVLEHEKAHIRQKHSMDHLFAHGLAVFQWFNPFAWQMRKALKTTHEYIADHQVLVQGIERFDYQALLLKQVIGYHSVELVNNFNLNPIKKRIAMMNKSRSGISAKFKAVLVIPIALIVFFLFADFTLKGTDSVIPAVGQDPEGVWVKQGKDEFSQTLFIRDKQFSYSEGIEIRDYFFRTEPGLLVLSQREGADGVSLKYEIKGDELTIWWNDSRGSLYKKSEAENTLDDFLAGQEMEVDLPYISQFRLMDNEMVFRISYGKDPAGGTSLSFNGEPFTLIELEGLVNKEKEKLSKLDQGSLAALFLIDRSIPMVLVNQVREELRSINSLHIAEGGYPHGDVDLSPLLYHSVALPRLLPPPNAKMLDKKEVEKMGGFVHTIDLSARNTTPRDVDEGLQKFISDHQNGKYVISLEFDGAIPYGEYVETLDMIYKVVYRFRNKLSQEKYQVPYKQLGNDLQKEIRKAYPMALSESMK